MTPDAPVHVEPQQGVLTASNLGKRFPWTQEASLLGRLRRAAPRLRSSGADLPARPWALRGVCLQLGPGERLALMGGCGAGKSTLLALLAGALSPDEGSVERVARIQTVLGAIPWPDPFRPVAWNLEARARRLGLSSTQLSAFVDDVRALMADDDAMHAAVGHLSSGTQQRLAVAAAIASKPAVLLVDSNYSSALGHLVQTGPEGELERRLGSTSVVFASNDRGLVNTLATRCLLLHAGRPVYLGPGPGLRDFLPALPEKPSAPQRGQSLDDDVLADINAILPWHCATELPDGRILGKAGALSGKRGALQEIPDPRIARLHDAVDLSGKSVVEIGCFEGVHTVGLCRFSPRVTAIDLRPINVAKTLMRLSVYQQSATVFQGDVESLSRIDLGFFDVIFHCGVLYHLTDPIGHLRRILECGRTILLDTHFAPADAAPDTMSSNGRTYRGLHRKEGGWADPFSGRGHRSFWPLLPDILATFRECGFAPVIWSERIERNGPRVTLIASRGAHASTQPDCRL